MRVTRVAICRHAAAPDRGDGDASGNGEIESSTRWLCQEIVRQGLGLFASIEDRDQFLSTLKDVERKRWVEFVIRRRLAIVLEEGEVSRIDRHRCVEDLRRTFGEHADLVLCGVHQGRRFGLPQSDDERPEVASLANVAQIATLAYDEEVVPRAVKRGTPRAQLWSERFAVLAQRVHRLVIVDRYGLSRHDADGIEWLLRQVFRDRRTGAPLKLELVVQATDQRPLAVQAQGAIERFGLVTPDQRRFSSIVVRVAHPDYGKWELHDRFLRFDGRVVEIGNGCALFSEVNVPARTTLSIGSYRESREFLDDVARQCERDGADESAGDAWCSAARWRTNDELWLAEHDSTPLDFSKRRAR